MDKEPKLGINNDIVSYPLVMYDTEKKKAVGVFKNASIVNKYVFQKERYFTYGMIATRRKFGKFHNIFQKEITFRAATVEYINQLGDKNVVVLDEEYTNKDYFKKIERKINNKGGIQNVTGTSKNIFVARRNEKIAALCDEGYIPSEIAKTLNIAMNIVTTVLSTHRIIHIPPYIGLLSKNKTAIFIEQINRRRNRLEKEEK